MPINYDFYETPKPNSRKGEGTTLHPRVIAKNTISTALIAERIQEATSLTVADVMGMLAALKGVVRNYVADGETVHLEGLGYFSPSLKTTEVIRPDTKFKGKKVYMDGINFRSDAELMRYFPKVTLRRVKTWGHSVNIGLAEIEQLLKTYFSEHEALDSYQFAELCQLRPSTARARIRTLCQEGKLEKSGYSNHPLYVRGENL